MIAAVSGRLPGPLTLGSVQFGLDYGITNRDGRPDDAALASLLDAAWAGGVRALDAARAYGDAEARLGPLIADADGGWHVTTKIAPLGGDAADPVGAARASLAASLAALRRDRVEVLMLHRAADVAAPGVVDALDEARRDGVVGALGVSVSTPEEAVRCLADARITHLQIPLNPLDWRWMEERFQAVLAGRGDVTVHARSAFLQGLLLDDGTRWPAWVGDARSLIAGLDRLALDMSGGRMALCLRFHASLPWVATTVFGVATPGQLGEVLAARTGEPLPAATMSALAASAAGVPARLLNPASW